MGKPYADGVMAGGEYINEAGLLPGVKLKMLQVDYAYNAQQALSTYKKFTSQDNIVFLQGWGTQDTEALTQFVARDKVPTLSASYSAHLTDPAKAPLQLLCGRGLFHPDAGGAQVLHGQLEGIESSQAGAHLPQPPLRPGPPSRRPRPTPRSWASS